MKRFLLNKAACIRLHKPLSNDLDNLIVWEAFFMSLLLIAAIVLGCLCTVMSFLVLFRFRWDQGGPALWAAKSYTCALAPFLGLAGVFCAVTGILTGSALVVLLGCYTDFIFFLYLGRLPALPDSPTGFANTFGPAWEAYLPAARKVNFLKKPTVVWLPANSNFTFQQNLSFCTLPGTGRQLVCDLWLPAEPVKPSGLAFIYLHGGAWYLLDKDFCTRTFFRHLACQGHVIMDVAYRLFPETNMTGMVQDAKRAIAWMKANAAKYGVDRNRIVIGGGSAGGHLSLLAAYLPDEPKLAPPELQDIDFSVQAVVAAYGPPDLEALYYHTGQQLTTRSVAGQPKKSAPGGMPRWVQQIMGEDYHRLGYDKPLADAGALASILGGHPDQCPEQYTFFSPITHVQKNCPPTLLIQGEHDMFTPVAATSSLYKKLTDAGVPAVMHLLPKTDHGFDLFLPAISPVAHTAFYDVERFLGLMAILPPAYFSERKVAKPEVTKQQDLYTKV